jgi:hypothetical protein
MERKIVQCVLKKREMRGKEKKRKKEKKLFKVWQICHLQL